MKKIGMIGGIGPESTVDYYQRIIRLYQQKISADDYPDILIYSINMTAMLKMVAEKDWDRLSGMLADGVKSLHCAGAELAFLASNTPHMVFDRVEAASPIPLVSIVEAAAKAAEALRLRKVGLLGTLFTMQSFYYQAEFQKHATHAVVPNRDEQEYIQQKLFTEIERGIFLDSTRDGLLKIIRRLIDDEAIDGVILGCTELPLILTKGEFGIPFLNTSEIHIDYIFDRCAELGIFNDQEELL